MHISKEESAMGLDSRAGEEPNYAQGHGKGQVTVNRTFISGAVGHTLAAVVRDRNSKVGNRAAKSGYKAHKGPAQIFLSLRLRTLE